MAECSCSPLARYSNCHYPAPECLARMKVLELELWGSVDAAGIEPLGIPYWLTKAAESSGNEPLVVEEKA